MADKFNFGNVNLGISPEPGSMPVSEDTPFRMLIVGDFSGRGNRGIQDTSVELATRKIFQIDRDNFDEVMQRLRVGLSRTIADSFNADVSVSFQELDDFGPDALFESVSLFESLRNLRSKLMDEATFSEAAAEVRSWTESSEQASSTSGESDSTAGSDDGQVALGDLLDNTIQYSESPEAQTDRWETMIRQIVEPHIVAAPDPQRDTLVQCVDAAISQSMRQLLHHPDFQNLEAKWRGLYLLVRRLDTGRDLQLHLLDVARAEVAEDLRRHDLSESGLYQLIVEDSVGTAGGQPFAAIIGCETYGADEEDVVTLSQLGHLASLANAPLIAGAKGQLVGCADSAATPDMDEWEPLQTADAKNWQELLESELSGNIGLLWPQFRGRIPYGAETSPIEAFEFEECAEQPNHSDYLWCSPAFAAALVLGQSFSESGWTMQPGEIDEVDNLPLCFGEDDYGDPIQLACTELWLSNRAAEKIRNVGIIPVMSVKAQAVIRVGNLLSLNHSPLFGGWTQ